MNGLPTDEVLAIVRLRQWSADRALLRAGRVVHHRHAGYRERRQRDADARNVRVADFELAFARLSQDEQTMLAALYRDRLDYSTAATLLQTSTRTLAYKLPAARQHLAQILDRLDLL